MLELIPLNNLLPGQSGRVAQLVGEQDHVRRMEELGLRAGVAIEMVQTGTPCIVRLGDNKLCFRGSECLSIIVQLGDCA